MGAHYDTPPVVQCSQFNFWRYFMSRTRNYATIVYPESAADNWLMILRELHVPFMVSPLHDQDLTAAGEPKKPHYHVQFVFDGVKSEGQVKEIVTTIGGVGVEVVESRKGYARYLCHLDDYDKAQYDPDDVRCFGGLSYYDEIDRISDKYDVLGEMMEFCNQYNVNSYWLLYCYARDNDRNWFRVLSDSGAVAMREFLQSRRWSIQHNLNEIVDEATGQVIYSLSK